MVYDKLVRDNIPEIIRQNGGKPKTRIAAPEEFWQKLKEKLREEVTEFLETENIEELADILEVIDAVCAFRQFDRNELSCVKTQKAKQRGTFIKRIILIES
ncbi:nucleoside triphosphate pyrophosphohydrolase [Patescibacteria group bacterium]|nr:nucleoside triphosphate pyrophosphohydrolase [Patescibacteria group bacterium]